MDAIQLLNEFAKSQGINISEVNKFLAQWDNPKTIEDLLKTPEHALKHYNYISYVPEPLKSFIQDELWLERYETLTLDTLVDALEDRISYAKDEDDGKLEKLNEIKQQIIDIKFGSVENDW